MANEDHVIQLSQGGEVWNAWRKKNPNVVPDLSGVNRVNPRRADLPDAEINGVRFIGTSLVGVNLSRADLTDTDFSDARLAGADLTHAKLVGVVLLGAN